MLRGSTIATMDEKGRLKVPTDFRRVLEERFGPDFFVTSVTGDVEDYATAVRWVAHRFGGSKGKHLGYGR